tara:strand:- start:134 stop:961 length:828 start_codon:yes stop_codon:yes gene_type:complete
MGTARTAYFNWLAARSTGGKFILRIDDTDLERNDESKTDDIISVMNWLGLDYDQLAKQSDRNERYSEVANQLIYNEVAKRLDDGSVVLDILPTSILVEHWNDWIAGEINIGKRDYEYISTMPLIKRNGTPTYNFANVVDDIDFGINLVIRGSDHQKNTGKQVVLYNLLGAKLPKYAHAGLLFKDKKKLSKSDGAASMIGYMEAGIDPDAMLNFLLRLGWGPRVDDKSTSILSRQRALELFLNEGKMKASPANIDLQKLSSFDRKYKGRKRNGQTF